MEPLASLTKRKAVTSRRLTKNSKIFKTILSAIADKKGEKTISLDLRKIPEAVADFFIVCEADNQPQIKAIADHVEQQVKEKCGENVYHKEGLEKGQWVLVDFVNVVVHIMQPESRRFYHLEEIWSDAIQENHS